MDFVAIDFATANNDRGSACAVGMVRVRDGKIVDRKSLLVKPADSLGAFADSHMGAHGITPNHVNGAPGWQDVLPAIVGFVQNDFVVAHNAPFDAAVITAATNSVGLPHPDMTFYCVLELTRSAIPKLPNHDLGTVAKAMKLGEFKHHDVEQEATITASACLKLAEFSRVDDLKALMSGYGVKPFVVGRGKEFSVFDSSELPPLDWSAPEQHKQAETTSADHVPLTRRQRREMDQGSGGIFEGNGPVSNPEILAHPSNSYGREPQLSSYQDHAIKPLSSELQPTPRNQAGNFSSTPAPSSAVTPSPTRQTSSEETPSFEEKADWRVFLLPAIPFVLAIVFSIAGIQPIFNILILIWMISLPTVLTVYIVQKSMDRKQRRKTPASRLTSRIVVASHNDQPSAVMTASPVNTDHPQATRPGAPTFPSKVTLLNAPRIANDFIQYSRSLEQSLNEVTLHADWMQGVFNRHDMDDMVALENTRDGLKAEIAALKAKKKADQREAKEIRAELAGLKVEVVYDEVGLIDYEHVAESSVLLAGQLAEVRTSIKAKVRDKSAYTYTSGFTFNNSTTKGKQFAERMAKIMLSAYNAESENAIKSLRGADGSTAARNKVNKSLERVTKNGEMVGLKITDGYHQLRLKEVDLAAQHLLAVRLERELEKERREELREQEKASKELQAEKDRLAKERQHYLNTLAAVTNNGDEEAMVRMQEKIDELNDAIENVDSRVANTRAGHVYIISNVGAFGEGIVKIGMTRRLDPMDRVKELGDASVPFRFDTHALFFAEDAVGVENTLHKHFASKRVNRVNLRREFFYTSPQAVLEALKEHKVEIVEFNEDFEAEEYRVSQEIAQQELAA